MILFAGIGAAAAIAGIVYLLLRHAETRSNDPSTVRRARSAVGTLVSRFDRVSDYRLDSRNLVLRDRVQLTAELLAEQSDRLERIVAIWHLRPSQPDDYLASATFASLPAWAKDAVVLLDLRRELQLRGIIGYLTTPSGVYCRDLPLALSAAQRSDNAELEIALRDTHPAEPAAAAVERTTLLLQLIDDERTWARVP